MSVKTLNLFDTDATFNLTRDDTLEIDFNRVAYPLSVVGTPTNCTVTPSSISATDKTFTADFSSSNIASYSLTLKNTGPDFGTDSDANFVKFNDGTNTSTSNTSITYKNNWGYVDADIYHSSTIFGATVGYSRPITTYSGSNILWSSVGGPFELAQTARQTSDGSDRRIHLQVYTKWNTATSFRRLSRGYVYSPEFTGNTGDYITYNGSVSSTANNDKCIVWALNTGTGDWVEIQANSFTGTRETLPSDGTYRIIVFLYQYINSSSAITANSLIRIDDFTRFNSAGVTKAELTVSGTVGRGPSEIIKASQKQELGDSIINLFEITLPSDDETTPTTLYLHDGLNFQSGTGKNIYFPNKAGTGLNEYIAFPIGIEGLEVRTGESPRPKLTLANIPVLGRSLVDNSDGTDDETNLAEILDDANLKTSTDLLKSKVVFRCTLLKYTFQSTDTPSIGLEYPSYTYLIDRVSNDQGMVLEVELASPADLEHAVIPGRLSAAKYCVWEYQGGSLYNRGGCTVPGDSFSRYFDENDRLITTNINNIAAWSSSTSYATGNRVRTSPKANCYRIWEALRSNTGDEPEYNKYSWKKNRCLWC